jgi:DNA-binding ferritin-like protein
MSAGLPTNLYAAAQLYAGERLQDLLAATLDLGRAVERARRNVRGRGSHPLQLLLDDLGEALADQRAVIAKRTAELGIAANGGNGAMAAESRLPELRDGPLPVADAAAAVVDRLDRVADLAREQLDGPGATDPENSYVLTGLTRLLERHRGVLRRAGA